MNDKFVVYCEDDGMFFNATAEIRFTPHVYQAKTFDTLEDVKSFVRLNWLFYGPMTIFQVKD